MKTVCSLALLAATAAGQGGKGGEEKDYFVYVGTYTSKASEGIYVFRFDSSSGVAGKPMLAAKTEEPSFLAIDAAGQRLYAVNETDTGGASAFRIEQESGKLELLNQVPSGGAHPAYISVPPSGRHVLVANYTGASVVSLPITAEGLAPAAGKAQHHGSSVNPERQKAPHPHAIAMAPGGEFAVAPDLGLDHLVVYRYRAADGALQETARVKMKPGAGPRHIAFHPDGTTAYAINELDSTITRLSFDRRSGKMEVKESISTLPPNFAGTSYTAEVVAHPNGKFVYGSNRGHDSIAVFRVKANGRLAAAGHTPTGGKRPRNFAIDPSGKWLFAANQESGSVVIFAIDAKTGALQETGKIVEIDSPVCIRFLAIPAR